MAEQNQSQAKSVSRRDEFAKAFGAAILMRQAVRTPAALAKEVIDYVDAFLTELDRPKGA